MLVWAVGSVGLLLAGTFAVAQTATGKWLIAELLGRALSSADTTVRLTGLDGLIPFDFRLAQLRMADAQGVWLELDDLRVSASPAALLRGRLDIEQLSARRLALHRLPQGEEAGGEPLPELPRSVPPVVVRSISIDRLEVGPAVLGQDAVFQLSGGMRTGAAGRTANVTLDLHRTDQATARAALQARLNLAKRTLALDLRASESGGLLAGLTGRPTAGNFALDLIGDGPLEDWHGDLRLEADGVARADARIVLALNGAARARVDGTLAPAPGLLPPPVARLLGERVQLGLTAAQAGPDQLAIEELRATAAGATLTGSGRIDLAEERVTARASLEVRELAPLGELAATPLDGSLELTAEVDGPLLQPQGRLALTMTDLAAGKMGAREVRATFDLSALQRLSEPGARVQVGLEGRAQGLRLPPEVQLPPQDVVWQGRLTAPVGGAGTIMVERLTMRADHLTATAQGMLDPNTLGGEAQVALTVDALAPFAERYGQPVDGTAELQANLGVGAGAEVISIDLYGGAHELSGLPDGLGALLGPVLTLEANAIVVPDDSVEVTHLRIEGAAATLDGRLELGLPRQTLDGALSIDLDNLAPLSPLLGLELDGPLTAQAQLGGAMRQARDRAGRAEPRPADRRRAARCAHARRLGRGHARGRGRQAPPGRDGAGRRGRTRGGGRAASPAAQAERREPERAAHPGERQPVDRSRAPAGRGRADRPERAAARARRVAAGAARGRARVRGARLGQGRRAGGRPDARAAATSRALSAGSASSSCGAASPTPCMRRASPPT